MMNPFLRSRGTRLGCAAAAALMAVVLFVGADPSAYSVPIRAPWDKVVHFLYYGTMALLLAHAVGRRWLLVPLLLVPAIGAFDEWHQSGIPGRDASFFDWLADELGTLTFVYVYLKFTMRG